MTVRTEWVYVGIQTMDRRSFLTLLGAAGVSVVLPKLWIPDTALLPVADEIKRLVRVSSPADQIFDIIICGKNDRSEVATFDVVRPGGEKILAMALNTYGGIIRWVACPGEELLAPLQFEYSDSNMTINVVGRKNDVLSFTVIESGHESPVVIPMTSTWDVNPMLLESNVPNVFKNAWDI